jgi:hypothetical protein
MNQQSEHPVPEIQTVNADVILSEIWRIFAPNEVESLP